MRWQTFKKIGLNLAQDLNHGAQKYTITLGCFATNCFSYLIDLISTVLPLGLFSTY